MSSFVTGKAGSFTLDQMAQTQKERKKERKENQSSIASPTPHICGVGKSVSINTFALGDDGLQIGH